SPCGFICPCCFWCGLPFAGEFGPLFFVTEKLLVQRHGRPQVFSCFLPLGSSSISRMRTSIIAATKHGSGHPMNPLPIEYPKSPRATPDTFPRPSCFCAARKILPRQDRRVLARCTGTRCRFLSSDSSR